ncbi:fimbrial protein [Pseudomonas asplenii]|uniref:fimbrial protein n=1 Tax=Pseudomonas asplenii TaxID=53407 RepID=UPI0006B6063F|nr:fimbrial protein [Pseudomonas fuscovaginae]KPA96440.1 P pilus assembly protein, pilin FimA [Pseudomonas fuscovaginae]
MNRSIRKLLAALLLAAGGQAGAAFAGNDSCYWEIGSGPLAFQAQLGTLYVPLNAPQGSVIGTFARHTFSSGGSSQLGCRIETPGVVLNFQARPSVALFPGDLPPVNGEDLNGKVFNTNIPGVGAFIKLGFPFDGSGLNTFIPVDGRPVAPFDAYQDQPTGHFAFSLQSLRAWVTLIKTGPIPAGPHSLDGGELFSGQFSGVGKGFSFAAQGTVIQAQCGTTGNPVSADPVRLGEWDAADFSGPGFGTPAVSFSITLTGCEADPEDENVAMATIRLDGVRGSQPIDEDRGIFSLTSDSSASGFGIQVLRGDGVTPVALGTEVPMTPIRPGTTVLDFMARFYQTEARVEPGNARGALNFTITYR